MRSIRRTSFLVRMVFGAGGFGGADGARVGDFAVGGEVVPHHPGLGAGQTLNFLRIPPHGLFQARFTGDLQMVHKAGVCMDFSVNCCIKSSPEQGMECLITHYPPP
ncbi:hypothetical protein L0665_09545 [Methanogenium marinum]|uniref:Uncharacterized protein n=1 Tax=Methanogenium marinum TaxID=348610 RepID=A0A9Q4PYJ7_9EURY|nr:hypothetical protein [Methanogenium marinum]MDE4908848.1 hypothetical protein [Methanogenium marinum]